MNVESYWLVMCGYWLFVQNIEYCKVLNIDNSFMPIHKNVKRLHANCKVKPSMTKAKALTNKAKAKD